MGDGIRKYLAEGVGTFVLVLGGVGAAVLAGQSLGVLGIAAAFGLALLIMVFSIGYISGCHVNPAVTVGIAIARGMGLKDMAGYIIAQLIGATVAAAIILVIAQGAPGGYDLSQGLGANGYGDHSPEGYDLMACAVTELVLSFVFILTILAVTDRLAPKDLAGVPIGLGLALVNMVGIPITNCSVNPARSFGPALLVGGWAIEQLWLFIIMPIVGAILAAGIYRLMGGRPARKEIT
ncbi:MAG: aquaporin Z [Methanomassiliicoccus sp.]|nr:aquaporin Z [Methanomassiliicoccus sp.]